MCGIAGLLTGGGPVDRSLLGKMNATLALRGPDDEGSWFDDEGGCGLGHRRLSIIDLEGGHQPLVSKDGQVAAVVNGEIYNFRELRAELEGKGHVFLTRSDSEVVVHGFREWGERLPERLEGMFAFAVWDRGARRLLMARDRMGQKPLYFCRLSQGLAFASEAKALFAHPEVSRRPDPQGLSTYLVYECLPEDVCLTEGMEKLGPGQRAVYEQGRLRVEPYWSMRFAEGPDAETVRGASAEALVEQMRQRILEAVEARLVADVPLGVLLSGGVDSSLITAAMTRLAPAGTVQSFSIAFEDPSFDESSHARTVAAHLGTQHHEERLSPSTMLDILPEIAGFMCEPLGDGSLIPTYLLSRFTRGSVKVALGGDGGDELFLGYPTFPAHRVARVMDRLMPRLAQKGVGRATLAAARFLPVSTENISFDFKVKRFASGLGFDRHARHQAWMGSFLPRELRRLLRPEVAEAGLRSSPYDLVRRIHDGSDPRDSLDEATLQYARIYLTGDVLQKVDRASMAASLEVRAPLLDRRVVELACALPSKLKLRGFTTKYLLKEVARPWLPPGIVDRPKKGFGVPIADWLRGPLRGLAEELLSPSRIRREGFFEPLEPTRLLAEHVTGKADHRKLLWTLIAFELWMDAHGPGSAS